MKVVISIDSFKGSLSSLQAGNAVKEAILKINSDTEVIVKPLADGGEGTVETLAECSESQIIESPPAVDHDRGGEKRRNTYCGCYVF